MLQGPIISEFSRADNGESFNGTCTQASAAMALAAQQNPAMTQQECVDLMVSMRDAMVARGEAMANGGATIAHMAAELRNRGAKILFEEDYTHGWGLDEVQTLLREHAGIHPIVLQVEAAHMLIDSSGQLEDANVNDHAIYVAGKDTAGYLVADPNTNTPGLDHYVWSDGTHGIAHAQPCGIIILDGPVTAPAAPPPPPQAQVVGQYTVQPGDSLSAIAQRLHIANWYHGLYQPNMAAIETAAQQHGHGNSNGGALIFAGTVLHYQH